MDRQHLDRYINEIYKISAEFPFESTPDSAVYRHRDNRKWFALIMDLPLSKFIPDSKENVSAVNLKCDPLLIGSLLSEKGIYPAYHMNKTHWISVILNNETDDDKLRWLLDLSYELTKK